MTTTTTPAARTSVPSRTAGLWRAGLAAGAGASLAATAVAAAAVAAGVPVEIEGQPIPLLGFAQLTLLCTVVGLVLAKALGRWATRPRRTFVVATVVLTGLSIVPDLTMPATPATRVVLILTHLVAAAIVIPPVARRLPRSR